MATIVLTLDGNRAVFPEKNVALMAALEERVGILGQQLYDTVMLKLSGGVLAMQSGALAGSVVLSAIESTGMAFESFVEIPEGSPQHLIGHVQEYGGEKWYLILPVNAQALRFVVGGSEVFARRVNHPPLPERSFLRSSLDEMTAAVYEGLQETIDEVLA